MQLIILIETLKGKLERDKSWFSKFNGVKAFLKRDAFTLYQKFKLCDAYL
ncbi:MAG: hypothetical protein JWQ40_2170 [Segetibacter sp.]|nr:hypothetical protein [Segetibacter sp.]